MTSCCVQHVVSSRIPTPFGELSASSRYVDEPLLTLTPLYLPCGFLARLACLNPAASVRSEPGSNSSKVFVRGSSLNKNFLISEEMKRFSLALTDVRRRQSVLDGPACTGPEINPEGLIPFFSSPQLLRCQRHRFYPVFPAFSRCFSAPWLTCGRRNM